MYKQNKYNKNKKSDAKKTKIIVVTFCFVVVGVTIIVANKYLPNQNDNLSVNDTAPGNSEDINYSPPSNEELQRAEEEKINNIENPNTSVSDQSNEVKIQESYQDSNSGQVVVKTELYGTGWDMCTLTLSKDSQKVIKTAETLYQQPYYSCLGFAIDSNEFTQAGEWKLELSANKLSGQIIKSSISTLYINP